MNCRGYASELARIRPPLNTGETSVKPFEDLKNGVSATSRVILTFKNSLSYMFNRIQIERTPKRSGYERLAVSEWDDLPAGAHGFAHTADIEHPKQPHSVNHVFIVSVRIACGKQSGREEASAVIHRRILIKNANQFQRILQIDHIPIQMLDG